MIATDELRAWLDEVGPSYVAIDEGGLTLYGFSKHQDIQEGPVSSIEIGGVPLLEEEDKESDHITESQERESIDGG